MKLFGKGKVYVGKQVDIGDILDSDDLEEMEEKLTLKGVEVYNADDFDEQFLPDLQKDLAAFQAIAAIWSKIEADPKYDAFLQNLVSNETLKGERVLIFTESRETGEYLLFSPAKYSAQRGNDVFQQNALHNGRTISPAMPEISSGAILTRRMMTLEKDFRILITTDVLAEGMNLHRAGRIINYDLPWESNPCHAAAWPHQSRRHCP